MEIIAISTAVASALIHALPHLTNSAGESAVKAAGGKLGEQAFELAKRLWQHLRPKIEASPAAMEAVKDAAADAEDPDNKEALRIALKKILTNDPALAELLSKLLDEGKASQGNHYSAQAGDGGVAVAGDLNGNVNLTNTFGGKK